MMHVSMWLSEFVRILRVCVIVYAGQCMHSQAYIEVQALTAQSASTQLVLVHSAVIMPVKTSMKMLKVMKVTAKKKDCTTVSCWPSSCWFILTKFENLLLDLT